MREGAGLLGEISTPGDSMPVLSPEAERLLRWLRFHRSDRRGEEMLQAAMDEGAVPDQGEFGRALLELAREMYVHFEVDDA